MRKRNVNGGGVSQNGWSSSTLANALSRPWPRRDDYCESPGN
ncbi:hypothetical protein ACNKHN_18275 [Shigella flexneri]